jgi:outer membrane PBP1 activator LpoA protein
MMRGQSQGALLLAVRPKDALLSLQNQAVAQLKVSAHILEMIVQRQAATGAQHAMDRLQRLLDIRHMVQRVQRKHQIDAFLTHLEIRHIRAYILDKDTAGDRMALGQLHQLERGVKGDHLKATPGQKERGPAGANPNIHRPPARSHPVVLGQFDMHTAPLLTVKRDRLRHALG